MIYFIEATWLCNGPIKIGATKDAKQRFASMQAYCPGELRLIGAVDGDYKDEALIHKAFCRQHTKSEWFSHSPELEAVIRRIVAGGMESVRADLLKLAANGFGIRIKSEAGKAAIRAGTSKARQSEAAQ
jgi:hypothetical protein